MAEAEVDKFGVQIHYIISSVSLGMTIYRLMGVTSVKWP